MDDRVVRIFSDLEKYFHDLESLQIKSLADLSHLEKYYASSMILFSLLNRVIDLGQEIVISNKLGMPITYKDIFRILAERKIIDKQAYDGLKKFIELRNILSHEYYRIESKEIFRAVSDIRVLREFISAAKGKLK